MANAKQHRAINNISHLGINWEGARLYRNSRGGGRWYRLPRCAVFCLEEVRCSVRDARRYAPRAIMKPLLHRDAASRYRTWKARALAAPQHRARRREAIGTRLLRRSLLPVEADSRLLSHRASSSLSRVRPLLRAADGVLTAAV